MDREGAASGYFKVFKPMPYPVLILDTEGTAVSVNPAFLIPEVLVPLGQ